MYAIRVTFPHIAPLMRATIATSASPVARMSEAISGAAPPNHSRSPKPSPLSPVSPAQHIPLQETRSPHEHSDMRDTSIRSLALAKIRAILTGISRPVVRQYPFLHVTMKRWSVPHQLHKAVLDRVEMDVINMPLEVPLVADCVFPEPPLP